MEEESKLLDKYYKDYYNTPPKNGSHDSRDSSTDERHVQYADPHNVSPTQLSWYSQWLVIKVWRAYRNIQMAAIPSQLVG